MSSYYQFDTFSVDEGSALIHNVLSHKSNKHLLCNGYILSFQKIRLLTFLNYGNVCVACGRTATFYAAEASIGSDLLNWYFNPLEYPLPVAYLNLYGVDKHTGGKFMMTSDHVVPYSLGGSDGISNRTVLCECCNSKKGNDLTWLDDLPRCNNGNLVRRADRQVSSIRKAKKREEYYG